MHQTMLEVFIVRFHLIEHGLITAIRTFLTNETEQGNLKSEKMRKPQGK